MTDPQTNYLINTAPELQERFVAMLKNITAFSQLNDEQLLQLFRYSKFAKLADQDRLIKQGDYDQEVFILVQGQLEVFMTVSNGDEEHLDIIFKPFSLVGAQCILGEPRNVTIEAKGEALLIGIDISLLPDIIDGFETSANRMDDAEYIINRDIFTVFATALVERLNRRVKDQYKLEQRARNLKDSEEFQDLLHQNHLATAIFNQFCRNELSPKLDAHTELQRILDPYEQAGQSLHELIHGAPPVNTGQVYMELIRAKSLGKLGDFNTLLFKIVESLTKKAQFLDDYSELVEIQFKTSPELLDFSHFLDRTYEDIVGADLTTKSLSKESFLEGLLVGTHPSPPAFLKYLEDGGWVEDQFSMAYIMFLLCQNCILTDLTVNQQIRQFINEIKLMGAPQQNVQLDQLRNLDRDQTLAQEVVSIYQMQIKKQALKNNLPPSGSGKSEIDDLLADFDL